MLTDECDEDDDNDDEEEEKEVNNAQDDEEEETEERSDDDDDDDDRDDDSDDDVTINGVFVNTDVGDTVMEDAGAREPDEEDDAKIEEEGGTAPGVGATVTA